MASVNHIGIYRFSWVLVSILNALSAVISSPCLADEKAMNIVLRAERNVQEFEAQQALVFKNDEILLSRNSNFFCAPADEVKLGAFSLPAATRKLDHEEVNLLAARVNERAKKGSLGGGRDSTQLRIYVGSEDISGAEELTKTAHRILESACDGTDWEAQNGISVRLEKAGKRGLLKLTKLQGSRKGKVSQLTFQEARCSESKATFQCHIPGFGQVFLKAPIN